MSESPPPVAVPVRTHYARYALGNVAALAAGFVSFPILARALSNDEFGVIGYVDAIVLVVVALLKFGLGDALLRFYPHGGGREGLRRFVASLVLVPMTGSLVLWAAMILAVGLAMHWGLLEHGWAMLLALAAVPLTVFASYVQWMMGAQERSGINALTGTGGRWLQTLLVIGLVLLVAANAETVYAGRLLAAVVMAVVMGWWLLKQVRVRFADADPALVRTALVYALPLALNEVSQVMFGFADRVILQAMLGDLAAVGIYSIGSSLAMYVSTLVGASLAQAYTPVLNRLYIQQGAPAVVQFKATILGPMGFVVALLVAGLVLVGSDFFLVVAGDDKRASAPVFVMLSVIFLLATLSSVLTYGALLAKRTGALLVANLVAVAVKIGANVLLIPLFGVMGTIHSTILGQVTLSVGLYLACPPALRRMPAPRSLLAAALLAVFAYTVGWCVLQALQLRSPAASVLVGGAAVVVAFGVPLPWLMPQARDALRGAWQRVRRQESRG